MRGESRVEEAGMPDAAAGLRTRGCEDAETGRARNIPLLLLEPSSDGGKCDAGNAVTLPHPLNKAADPSVWALASQVGVGWRGRRGPELLSLIRPFADCETRLW